MKRTLLTLAVTSLLTTTAFADPIHDAAKTGNLAGVQAELDKGVDVNAKTSKGWTPLHYVAQRGQKEVANLLFTRGADVNAKTSKGWAPLHYAAQQGHKETAELLIGNGADVNAKTIGGLTPLDWAVRRNKTAIVEVLREHGGVTTEELKAAKESIHDAAKYGIIVAVKQHLTNGVNVNAKDEDGVTPLYWAARYGHSQVAELLIANGADMDPKNGGIGTLLPVFAAT